MNPDDINRWRGIVYGALMGCAVWVMVFVYIWTRG